MSGIIRYGSKIKKVRGPWALVSAFVVVWSLFAPHTIAGSVKGQSGADSGPVQLANAASKTSVRSIHKIRTWPAPDHTRVVFDTTGAVQHSIFRLSDPERLVVDLFGVKLKTSLEAAGESDNLVKGIRAAVRGSSGLRVVFDLKRRAKARSFALRPNPPYGHRLVIDLEGEATKASAHSPGVSPRARKGLRKIVVAIDPGHGGEDPGASGRTRVREKDVVLAISKRLARELNASRGFKAVLTRSGDYYVSLRGRMKLARKARADLFLSIHADAFRDRRVRGSSVYVLSRNGASSEAAKWLADRENAADLVGGVRLGDKDNLLASVLLDLSQAAALSASGEAGIRILKELNGVGKLHKRQVQRAGFMVLKSPDVPSILIETGFITNPDEERRLKDRRYQAKLAKAIARGVNRYFEKNAPDGTLLAARRHTISPGETLSHISARYQVTVDSLRSENRLHDDSLRVGQVLHIPEG